MSENVSPVLIDIIEFAKRGKVLKGRLSPLELPGVAEQLMPGGDAWLDYTLTGRLGARGAPELVCEVRGLLALQCQRCLGMLEFPVDTHSILRVETGTSAFDVLEDEDDEVDVVPAESGMDVQALVGEEILLNLPIAPMHAPDACQVRNDLGQDADSGNNNPFGVLATLRGNMKSKE